MCDLKVYINKDFKIIVINIDEYNILVKNILSRSNCSCSLIKKMGVLTTKWKTTPINVHNRCWLGNSNSLKVLSQIIVYCLAFKSQLSSMVYAYSYHSKFLTIMSVRMILTKSKQTMTQKKNADLKKMIHFSWVLQRKNDVSLSCNIAIFCFIFGALYIWNWNLIFW